MKCENVSTILLAIFVKFLGSFPIHHLYEKLLVCLMAGEKLFNR